MIHRFFNFLMGLTVLVSPGLLRAGDPEQVDASFERFLLNSRQPSSDAPLMHISFGNEDVELLGLGIYENARTGLRLMTYPSLNPDSVGVGNTIVREVHTIDYLPLPSDFVELRFGHEVQHSTHVLITKKSDKGPLPLAILKGRGDSEMPFLGVDEMILLSDPSQWPKDRLNQISKLARTVLGLKGSTPLGTNILKTQTQRIPLEFFSAQFSRPIIDLDGMEGLPTENMITSTVVIIEREYNDTGHLVGITADIGRASRSPNEPTLFVPSPQGPALSTAVSMKWLARNLVFSGVSETRRPTLQPGAGPSDPTPCRQFLAMLYEAEGPKKN